MKNLDHVWYSHQIYIPSHPLWGSLCIIGCRWGAYAPLKESWQIASFFPPTFCLTQISWLVGKRVPDRISALTGLKEIFFLVSTSSDQSGIFLLRRAWCLKTCFSRSSVTFNLDHSFLALLSILDAIALFFIFIVVNKSIKTNFCFTSAVSCSDVALTVVIQQCLSLSSIFWSSSSYIFSHFQLGCAYFFSWDVVSS